MMTGKRIDPNSSSHDIASEEKIDQTSLHSSEADVGYELFRQNYRDQKDGSIENDGEADSNIVLKKIDRRILPILCATLSIDPSMR